MATQIEQKRPKQPTVEDMIAVVEACHRHLVDELANRRDLMMTTIENHHKHLIGTLKPFKMYLLQLLNCFRRPKSSRDHSDTDPSKKPNVEDTIEIVRICQSHMINDLTNPHDHMMTTVENHHKNLINTLEHDLSKPNQSNKTLPPPCLPACQEEPQRLSQRVRKPASSRTRVQDTPKIQVEESERSCHLTGEIMLSTFIAGAFRSLHPLRLNKTKQASTPALRPF